MIELQEEEVQAALALARMERERYRKGIEEANREQRGRVAANENRYQQLLLKPIVTSAATHAAELERVRDQNYQEIRQFLTKQRHAAVKESGHLRTSLDHGIAQWRKAVELIGTTKAPAAAPKFNFNFVVLDTPFFIFPSQGIDLVGISKAPWNNVAKFTGEWNTPYPDNGGDYVSFIFVWKNPADHYSLIDVESYLAVNGFCDVFAEGGVNAGTWGSNFTTMGIAADLNILEYWNNPPTAPMYQQGEYVNVLGLDADGGGLFGLGTYRSSGVNGNFDALYKMLLVPPQGVVVFEMSLSVGHWTNGGYLEVDFASGDFQVNCPAVVIAILG